MGRSEGSIAIVGAGIGGSSAAIFRSRLGFEVTVNEGIVLHNVS